MDLFDAEEDYYEILNSSEHSTFEDIKKSYQNLLLKHHPDKNENNQENENFFKLDRAWKVLRDTEMRQRYDAERAQQEFVEKPIVNEVLSRRDLTYNKSGIYHQNCRCSGQYSIAKDEIESTVDNLYVSCSDCSLVIEINCK